MLRLLAAPFAEFFKLNLFRDEFLVLAGPVINPFASDTGKFYKAILGHMFILVYIRLKSKLYFNLFGLNRCF